MLYVVGGTLLAAAVLAGPAWGVAGQTGLLSVLGSAVVCLLPGLVLVALLAAGILRNPLHVLLVSTGLRMAFVLGVVLVVRIQEPALGFAEFYLWIALIYLAALAAETLFLSKLNRADADSSEAKGS